MSSRSSSSPPGRAWPVGAEILPEGTHFRVWAPRSRTVAVTSPDGRAFELDGEDGGYFSGTAPEGTFGAGARYKFQLESGRFPDPVSRYQPDGPHGFSEVVDARAFRWTDHSWPGAASSGHVIYELHVGTFTPGGAWRPAAERLAYLRDLGVTILEIMPVADFAGRRGWGYDGVNLFAPSRLYGTPDDFRAFVDQAHAEGLGVILDVVYNHIGPDGNFLARFSPDYFTADFKTEWGEALNFAHPSVREFFIANAASWIAEFHLDGLRLDATQQIFDTSQPHILAEIVAAARKAAGPRNLWIVAENEPQDARLARAPRDGGHGIDALWNDDFHHAAMVALTGRAEAYYSDYRGTPQEFVSAARHGFLYQGQRSPWQKAPRGAPALDLPPGAFVNYLQNHDQIANSLRGHRVHVLAGPGKLRTMTALLFLSPGTPMLFQGQEFASNAPFLYFADHQAELAARIAAGRAKFLRQFPSIASAEAQELLQSPEREETFLACKLDFGGVSKNAPVFALHRDLIALRRNDPVLRRAHHAEVDGAVLSEAVFFLRYFARDGGDRLALFNFGSQTRLEPIPEPLMAPPAGREWRQLWSSEDVRYGGEGDFPARSGDAWQIPARCAILLGAEISPPAR